MIDRPIAIAGTWAVSEIFYHSKSWSLERLTAEFKLKTDDLFITGD